MPTFREKLQRINWSPFFVRVVLFFLFIALVPQFLFAIPYWLENEPHNLDLDWQLLGDHDLPSALLTIFYFFFGVSFALYLIIMFDYKYGRDMPRITCECNQFKSEDIKIPIGGKNVLVGELVKSPLTLEKNAPVLIVHHGLGSTRQKNYQYGKPFTILGFAVLFYDARGHGETTWGKKWDGFYIIRDLAKAVDFIEKRAQEIGDVDSKNIVAMGFSLGGATVLNEGYLDHRIKFVMGMCAFGDYKFTTDRRMRTLTEFIIKAGYEIQGINLTPTHMQNRFVSAVLNSFNKRKGFFGHPVYWDINNNYRVLLAHCKDDEFVNFENFEQNRDFLKLNPENYLVFDNGNHKFSRGETALSGKMLLWMWQRGY